MLFPFIFLSATKSPTVDVIVTSSSLTLTDVGPISATFSSTIEYRDLIYASLDIQGKEYHKTTHTVLDCTSSMCYLKTDAMGLSVTNPICTAMYGCGESFEMNIGIIDDRRDEPQVSYDCMLLNFSRSKYESILGISLIGRPSQQVLTLIPLSQSEITFSAGSSAEYTISEGRIITSRHLNEDQDCIGDIATVDFFYTSQHITRLSYVDMSIYNKNSEFSITQTVIVTFDTNLAQSEYSSKFLDLMADFEYLKWSEKGPENFIFERRNLKMFADGNEPYLRIGVDIIRNLAISFDPVAVYFCQPKYSHLRFSSLPSISHEELHGIKVVVQRDDPLENVKILINYDVAVQVEMMRNDILIFLKMDTGSDFTVIPKLYMYPCEKGDSSFYCSYAYDKELSGSKTVLSLGFPIRHKDGIKPKTFTVIGGISEKFYDFYGVLGLQYKDNAMDSLPYIWKVEWMVFIPEVIKPMEVDDSTIRFPNGRGLGRLVLTNKFNTEEICQGDILVFPADRSTWVINELKIEFNINGNKQVFSLDKVFIDTEFTISQLCSYPINEINEADEIKIVSSDGKYLTLPNEESLPFFEQDYSRNIIGVNILRKLVTGLRMFPQFSQNKQIGEVVLCIPRKVIHTLREIKKEIYQSEIDKMRQILKEKGVKEDEYECQNVAGFNMFREILQNAWRIEQGMVLTIDWNDVKEKVTAWVPWTLCFQDFASFSIESGTIVSRVILESI
jgi:hypothetical protein